MVDVASDSITGISSGIVGSNPTLSARFEAKTRSPVFPDTFVVRPMSTDCPQTFSQGIFLRPKLCSYQVIKLPVAGDDAGDDMEVSEAPAVSLTAGYRLCGEAGLSVLFGRPPQISTIL